MPFHGSIQQIKAKKPKGLIITSDNSEACIESAVNSKELYELGVPVLFVGQGAQEISMQLGGKAIKAEETGSAAVFGDAENKLLALSFEPGKL